MRWNSTRTPRSTPVRSTTCDLPAEAAAEGSAGCRSAGAGSSGGTQTGDNTSLSQECSQSDAIKQLDCRNVLYVNSIQNYWAKAMPRYFNGGAYKPAKTVFFSN